MTFVKVELAARGAPPSLQWADGMTFSLPSAVLQAIGGGGDRLDRAKPGGTLTISEPLSVARNVRVDDIRLSAAFTDSPPASARLPITYRSVPGWVRSAVAAVIGRAQRHRSDEWASFPGWPLDLTADLVSDLVSAPRVDLGDRTPVLLTHDIDSPEGLERLVTDFLPLEEAAGARSANYVVPCAWVPDHGLLSDLVARGHEIGVHGYDHSNRTPFADDEQRRMRLDAPKGFIERYKAVGYRAPSLLRTRALVRDLATRYQYDSSIPTSGGLFPVPNNGCASARPFRVEGIVEIPLTLPRDGSLRFLGYSPVEMTRLWIDCAEVIGRAHGVVVLLTHCERRFSGNRAMLAAYGRVLEHFRNAANRFVFRTPADLVARLKDERSL